jgi:prepilin-type N-terminal cleavage/methylation domain-containing protein
MFTNHYATRRRASSQRGFTIVELIISIGVVAILISIALYGLGVARKAASRTTTANALRQLVAAYNAYANTHERLMPGYIDPADFNANEPFEDLEVRLRDGTRLTPRDKASYVWRLAPYLDHAWNTYMADYRSGDVTDRFESEYAAGVYGPGSVTQPDSQIGIAMSPSFGMNSIFVGGDSFHGGGAVIPPWRNWPDSTPNSTAATRISQVRSASKLIVFAPTRGVNLPAVANVQINVQRGYVELRPPYLNYNASTQSADVATLQWQFDAAATTPDSINDAAMTGFGGLPVDRLGGRKVALGHLDGSVSIEQLESLGPSVGSSITLMSRWSPFATGFN